MTYYVCGHPRTPANTVQRRKHPKAPKTRYCKTCEQQQSREAQQRRNARNPGSIVRKPWIVPTSADYKARMAAALAQYRRETGEGQTVEDQRQHNLWGPR